MNRRLFLRTSALTTGFATQLRLGNVALAGHSPAAWHSLEAENDNILIVIQLFGGNDGLNTVIPADDDRYYARFRPKLGIKKDKAVRLAGGSTYLHPALQRGVQEGLLGLHKAGRLATVQGVGYPNPDLSHFRSTDIWLSGEVPTTTSQRLETGWLGRYCERLIGSTPPADPLCLRIGSTTSLLFQGTRGDLSIAVENPEDFFKQGKDILSGEDPLTGGSAFAQEFNFIYDIARQSNVYSQSIKRAFDAGKNVVDYGTDGLSTHAKLVARLISGGLKSKVYLLSLDGFDTHANQGADGGMHAKLLGELSSAVASLMADLDKQQQAKRVVGLTVSEFGRRPEENASNGTDHGAASVMFLFGEAVKGRVVGQGLSFDRLDTNNDFRHEFDYRRVYDELLRHWLGADDNTVRAVLGNRYDLVDSGLLRRPDVALSAERSDALGIYPNPTPDGLLTVQITLPAESAVRLQLFDARGRALGLATTSAATTLPAGRHQLPARLPDLPGTYVLRLTVGDRTSTHKVVRL